jgi:hypothetical protein
MMNNNHPIKASDKLPKRSQARGILWVLLGAVQWLLGIVSLLLISVPQLRGMFDPYIVVGLAFAAGIFLPLGALCYNYGRKLDTITFDSDVYLSREAKKTNGDEDARPPVLYLRSFLDDSITAKSIKVDSTLSSAPIPLTTTEEEVLTSILAEIGPGVAIGEPGEKVPDLGMTRIYATDDKWQTTVLELMSRANLVVMRAGDTGGFWWEVQQIAQHIKPERLVFLLPFEAENELSLAPNKTDGYEIFRQKAEKYLPCKLPLFYGTRTKYGGSLTGILYFEPGWTPHIVELSTIKVPLLRRSATPSAILKIALGPVFKQLNLKWTPPDYNPLIIICLLGISSFYLMLLFLLARKILVD